MKTKTSLKKRCPFCKFIKRNNTLYIYCIKGKHKQRQK